MTDSMFARLRLRLTALYLAATVVFALLIGAITYGLIDRYFQTTTDLALRTALAAEISLRSRAVPADLAALNPAPRHDGSLPRIEQESDRSGNREDDREGGREELEDDGAAILPSAPPRGSLDVDLAAIQVRWFDAAGQGAVDDADNADIGGSATTAFAADLAAIQAAAREGSDARSVQTGDGRARVLTYALAGDGARFVQARRLLIDQDRLLQQLLLGLIVGGTVVVALSTVASWWLAGRSLRPLQLAWERQRDFVANASHELRTPLSLMQLSAELAQRPDTPEEERRELTDDVLRETHYMTGLIRDLLLLSRLDAGQLHLDTRPVPMAAALHSVRDEMSPLAAKKGVALEVGEAAGTALADETRLRQVLLGLIDNALRHTPAGGRIALTARPERGSVRIGVDDTGAGIAPEHLARVFDRFYRADAARTGRGNAGLGLQIARSLVEAMGGHIELASQPGAGTRVTIVLLLAE